MLFHPGPVPSPSYNGFCLEMFYKSSHWLYGSGGCYTMLSVLGPRMGTVKDKAWPWSEAFTTGILLGKELLEEQNRMEGRPNPFF